VIAALGAALRKWLGNGGLCRGRSVVARRILLIFNAARDRKLAFGYSTMAAIENRDACALRLHKGVHHVA
jgi:hypothetical protein